MVNQPATQGWLGMPVLFQRHKPSCCAHLHVHKCDRR